MESPVARGGEAAELVVKGAASPSGESVREEAKAAGLKHVWSAKAIDARGRHAQRRKETLAKQKQQRRKAYLDNVRQLAEQEAEEEEAESDGVEAPGQKKGTSASARSQKRKRARRRGQAEARKTAEEARLHRDQLTLPEPMQEVPDDLAEAWTGVAAPAGERCLVVAAHSSTAARDLQGNLLERFASALPNGARLARGKVGAVTVLDCIFNEALETFFVLDVVCWKGTLYYECDAAFRRYWLESRLAECPQLAQASSRNHYKFLPVASFPCTASSLGGVLQSLQGAPGAVPPPYPVETLLFYCNEGHYHMGTSPLVLYLPVAHCSALVQHLAGGAPA